MDWVPFACPGIALTTAPRAGYTAAGREAAEGRGEASSVRDLPVGRRSLLIGLGALLGSACAPAAPAARPAVPTSAAAPAAAAAAAAPAVPTAAASVAPLVPPVAVRVGVLGIFIDA